jgi:TonB-linked SusC/RagA family outer membrane protein
MKLTVLMLIFCLSHAGAATWKITGRVVDDLGEPVIGANVTVKGTTNGTITGIDGNFILEVSSGSILRVSYIGYLTREIVVGSQSVVHIVLAEDTRKLDEVVVVGYGTQRKVTVTGSVSSIGTDEIVQAPVSNISNALAGRLPGVRVQNSGGIPGSEATVDIRGFGKPLVLVDGIEQPGFQIDPNEIESISVLKDASAAIYGVKAGNGVLLITTKKGTTSKPRITYNGSVGVQNLTSYPDVVNAAQYAELIDEDAINRGNDPIYGPEKLALFKEGKQEGYKSYNWKDILIRSNAPQTQHNINVNGGSEEVTYFASIGYLNQEGLYTTKDLGFNRYNFRSNVTAKIARYLTTEVQLGGHIENKHAPYDDDDYITFGITRIYPTFSPYANDMNEDYYGLTNYQNPLARADIDVSGYKREKKKLFNGSFALTYDMPFVPGLSAKVLFSYLTKVEEYKTLGKEFYLYSYDLPNDAYDKVFTGNAPSHIRRKDYTSEQNLLQFSLNYKRSFLDKHNVSALLLYEQREDLDDYVEAYRQFAIDVLDQVNAGMDRNKDNGGMESEMANVSFVGRINYDYRSKYLFEFAFREDGSAKFYRDNRWGFFPSVSAGWRISEESFVKENVSFIDNLKLRASYGIMGDDRALDRYGNETVKAFQYLAGYKYPGDKNYIFGDDVIKGLNAKGLSNLSYTWLKTKIVNIGVDVSLWNRLFEASVDVFYRKRDGLVATRALSLPNTFGSQLPQENLNSDDYRGFEIVLGQTNQIHDFVYSIKGNMSFTRMKDRHVEKSDPINSYTYWRNDQWQDENNKYSGRWQNILYGYKCAGQFNNQEEINNWAVQDGAGNTTLIPGDLKYEDYNADGIINDYDVQPVRRNNIPEIYFGLNLSAQWKGFDLSLLMQGATNYSVYMNGAMGYPLFNGSTALDIFMDRWHRADLYDLNSEWIPGKYPSTYNSGKESNKRMSTFNMINAYYLRVKNVELGYTFPKSWVKKAGMDNLRLYFSGNNLLTFDNLPFGDPEAPSRDRILYPQLRIINAGVNITF